MSHLGKDEYFSCGPNESIHNIVTPGTEGNRESGHPLYSLMVFVTGAGSVREGGINFVIFLFTFSATLPKKWIGNGEENGLFGANNSNKQTNKQKTNFSILGRNERCMWRIGRFKSPEWICIVCLIACVFLVDANSTAL